MPRPKGSKKKVIGYTISYRSFTTGRRIKLVEGYDPQGNLVFWRRKKDAEDFIRVLHPNVRAQAKPKIVPMRG